MNSLHEIALEAYRAKCPKKFLAYLKFTTPHGLLVELAFKHNRQLTKRVNRSRWATNRKFLRPEIKEPYNALIKIKTVFLSQQAKKHQYLPAMEWDWNDKD